MKLKSLLNPELVIFDSEVSSKEEVIDLFIKNFSKHYRGHVSEDAIRKAIYDREKLGETVFPPGIAMPHGRLDNFDDLIIGVLFPKNPILCDDTEVRVFVVLLTSKAGSSTYIQTLATFANLVKTNDKFEELYSCRNIEEFFNIIKDVDVKKELNIEDIMTVNPISVKPETTLKEVTDIYYMNNISYVPVIDDNNNFIGELSMQQLLKVAVPDYAQKIGNLNFLNSFAPFEILLKNEDNIKVREVMKEPKEFVKKEDSIIQAVLIMTEKNRRYLPVVNDSKVIGVISYTDLLKKVIRS